MKAGKVNILIDGQWGSTGKGKLAGYLARRHEIGIAATMTSPNAGHTYVSDAGESLMLKQLPTAAINSDALVVMTPHCVLNEERLLKEAEMVNCSERLRIHPHAAVVTNEHLERERGTMNRISSTLQGGGAALAARIMREPAAVAASRPRLQRFLCDTGKLIVNYIRQGRPVLLEMSQGFDLSLTWGLMYPYVTSRDITTATGLNAAGVPPSSLGDVYGCIRAHPIRVGHAFDNQGNKIGDSGPCYPDQEELTWDEITRRSGSPISLLERTTVTNKVRRIFTFSNQQMEKFIRVCEPTILFVNFVNYWDHRAFGCRAWDELPLMVQTTARQLQTAVRDIASALGRVIPNLALLGTGPRDSEMVEISN